MYNLSVPLSLAAWQPGSNHSDDPSLTSPSVILCLGGLRELSPDYSLSSAGRRQRLQLRCRPSCRQLKQETLLCIPSAIHLLPQYLHCCQSRIADPARRISSPLSVLPAVPELCTAFLACHARMQTPLTKGTSSACERACSQIAGRGNLDSVRRWQRRDWRDETSGVWCVSWPARQQ